MIVSISDFTMNKDELNAKLPDKRGTLTLKKKDGITIAIWRGRYYPIRKEDDCIKIFLPNYIVRVFESDSGGHFVMDYQEKD